MIAWNRKRKPKFHTKTKIRECWLLGRNIFYSRNMKSKQVVKKCKEKNSIEYELVGKFRIPDFVVYKKSDKRKRDIRLLKGSAGFADSGF